MWLLSQLLLSLASGSSDVIMGPGEVRGLEQGSLTVQCHYVTGWETHVKWWCQGADWKRCRTLVKTNGSEQEVKKDRVSIRDNQRNRMITVTMTELRQEDTGIYWCGIERVGSDPGVQVRVTIDTATRTALAITTFTTTMFTVPVTLESATESPAVTSHDSDTRSELSSVHFLLLVFLEVPLLLSMLGAVLWVNRPQRSSGQEHSQPQSENK